MNDLDYLLNGKGSRELHLEITRLAQQPKIAHKVKPSNKVISLLRIILVTAISILLIVYHPILIAAHDSSVPVTYMRIAFLANGDEPTPRAKVCDDIVASHTSWPCSPSNFANYTNGFRMTCDNVLYQDLCSLF